MERVKVAGIPIGCPGAAGEGGCHPCAGGWPGTKASGESLIRAARSGKLDPQKMACGPLAAQVEFLIRHFENQP